MSQLDIETNRARQEWSNRALIGRLLWGVASVFFRFSPRPLWAWRVLILRAFGAKIGQGVHIYPTVRIIIPWNLDIGDMTAVGDHAILYGLGKITIGTYATVSQGAHLCAGTHDIRDKSRPLVKTPITIGDSAWVAADAFIGPGVTVGDGAIVGARSVAMRDVAPHVIAAGNPAQVIRQMPVEN